MLVLYLRIIDWIDSKTKVIVREDERERFFHRGTVTRQLDYIKAQGSIFLVVTLMAIICTFGHLTSYPTFHAPETMANVFCKSDPAKELHCRVNMTYVNPAHTLEHWKDKADEWDFCGSFTGSALQGTNQMKITAPPAGCLCTVSGPCLAINQKAIVAEASAYDTSIWLNDVEPNSMYYTFLFNLYKGYDYLAHVGCEQFFGLFLQYLPRDQILSAVEFLGRITFAEHICHRFRRVESWIRSEVSESADDSH
jgi:hypothetical protein